MAEQEQEGCWGWCPGGHDGWCAATVGQLPSGFDVVLRGDRSVGWQEVNVDEAELDQAMAGVLAAVATGNGPRIAAVDSQYGDTEWDHVFWCRREHDDEGPCDAALLHTEGGTVFYLECDPNGWPLVALRVCGIPRPAYPGETTELRLGHNDLADLALMLADAVKLMAESAQSPPVPSPDAKVDKLNLAKRIHRLQWGEYLAASDRYENKIEYNNEVLLALIAGPAGPHLRLGIIHPTDRRKWIAEPCVDDEDDGSTVILDPAGVAQLDVSLAEMAAAARAVREKLVEILLRAETLNDEDYGYKTSWMAPWEPNTMSSEQFHEHMKTGYRFADHVTDDQKAAVFELFDYAGVPQATGMLASGPWGALLYRITPRDECGSEDAAADVEVVVRPADAADDWHISHVTDYDRQLKLTETDIPELRQKIAQFWSK